MKKNFSLLLMAMMAVATAGDAFARPKRTTPNVVRERAERFRNADLSPYVRNVARQDHPRIFATADDFAALRKRIAANDEITPYADFLRATADFYLTRNPLERKLTGRRLLGVSRSAESRILTLAMCWRIYGEKKYLDRAIAELKALCAFEDWNPKHFLDVGEMSVAVGVGYDWLYDQLDAETRKTIETAIREKGMTPFMASRGYWSNNWGQVCIFGCLTGAAAIAETCPKETTELFRKALAGATLPMTQYAPAGNFPEGPGYWCYATMFTVFGIDLLNRNFKYEEEKIEDMPGFRESMGYLDLAKGPSGMMFNYSDSGTGAASSVATFYFAKRFGRNDIIPTNMRPAFEQYAAKRTRRMKREPGNRFYPLLLLWYTDKKDDTKPTMPLVWNPQGKVPITIQRSGWSTNDMFVGLKGGSPSGPHAHMDAGSFVLDWGGQRWAYDLGAQSYESIESRGMSLWNMSQDSDRWKVYRLSTWAHNTLMIDGEQQCVTGSATITSAEPRERISVVDVDLTSLYPAASKVTRRGKLANNGCAYEMTDMLEGLKDGAKVRWAMQTKAEVKINGERAILSLGGRQMIVEKKAEGSSEWQVLENNPPNEWDHPNKGFRQILFFTTAKAGEEMKLRVRFIGCAREKNLTQR